MAKKRGNNEGSIGRLPSGTWRAQIMIQGKRFTFSSKVKSECQSWIRSKQAEMDAGLDFEGGQMKLKDFLLEWLATARLALRLKTAHQYERLIHNHIIRHIGDMRLRDLRLDRIEQFYSALLQEGRGVRTVRIVHNILHKSLEKAVRYNYILRNPAHKATLPRVRQQEMLVLDESQVTRFLIASQGSPYETFYRLAIITGMRQGELFGLKWVDLHWDSGALHVRRQVQRVDGYGWQFVEPKTRAGTRTIKLGEGMLLALRQHKQQQDIERSAMGNRWVDNGLIFPNTVGNPMDPTNMRKDFNRILEEAGLPRVRFHDLRHTAASLMLNNNIPVIVASKILGHGKPSVTLDIYGHLYHEMQTEAAKVMEEIITPVAVHMPDTVVKPSRA